MKSLIDIRQYHMTLDLPTLKNILLTLHYVGESEIKEAESHMQHYGGTEIDYLLSKEILTKDIIGQAIAEHAGVPYADLNSYPPSKELLGMIPESFAAKYRVTVFKKTNTTITLATDTPENPLLSNEAKKLLSAKKIIICYSLTEDIDATLSRYQKPLETRFSKIIAGQKRVAPNLLDEIFNDAIQFRASDIHFEPREKEVIIRFRIDGHLSEAGRISKEIYENILNRIKVQARMRIDQHAGAQDGSIRYEQHGHLIEMRVSVAAVLDGEKVVLRMLMEYIRSFSLADLGFSPHHQHMIVGASEKPFGMVLVVGPTGSGKSTTLYALIKLLNQPNRNITTIEDPVEYKMSGVNQMQVNVAMNFTFATGLRSIVRQDPNVILVGEIRDGETAEIAVNAALTGHLLLSTFHANDAATAIPRLLEMGVQPFLASSTIELIVAQRLVRKLCEGCRSSYRISASDIKKKYPAIAPFLQSKTLTLYGSKGCQTCHDKGYYGRTALFEMIPMTPQLRELLLKNPSSQQIAFVARQQKCRTLFEDGLEKVLRGITTIEELLHAAQPPQI